MITTWKQQLSGATAAILQLPTNYPHPAAQTSEGAQQSLVLSETLAEALQELSRQEGVTLFMIVLAAFQILIQRYTGQEDFVVGLSIASRQQTEAKELIGFLANTLALRINLSGNPSFRELLTQVQEVTIGAEPVTKVAMTLYVKAQDSELKLRLVYQRTLFSHAGIMCMLDQLQYLLEQIVAAPEKAIHSFSLVTPASLHLLPDPHQALAEPEYELVTTLFAAWANRAAGQPAVCQDSRTWTYQELAESAYSLARFLLTQGIESGDVVAILGQQSFGLIASMLAVLLAGGVILPIDWDLPAQRQQMMLHEAGARHLLYIGNWRPEDSWVQELASVSILRIDPDKGLLVEPKSSLDVEAVQLPTLHPDDAAYIFFTSGTTGIPKGVLGCHKGLSHFLNWQRETFGVGPRDRCAQLTNLSFDAVLRDIFLPLTSGGTLCLPKESDTFSPDRILLWLERERISLLHTVPARAHSWLTNIPPEVSLQTLRWVFFSGEPLTDGLVNRWRGAFPLAGEIVNLYGPTETTLVKCFYRVPPTVLPGVQPAGWPQPETQALVLRGNNQLCGIGELGEIVLRTPFRTLGYINALEENQKRFIKNPFRDDEGDVLYRTGDRGRYRPDGSLEILGRLDYQVKIRGVRVEPDEVMATLLLHPGVQSCVVIAQKDEQGQNSLVAYVAIGKQERVTSSELRSFLSRQLPSAMIPSVFVLLDALPLLPNGKVDHKALPALDQAKSQLEEAFVAPRTPIEKALAGIWAGVFGLERVGVYDNFFELGGHSLLATQIMVRIRDVLQIDLSLRSIFEKPTLADLALQLEKVTPEEPGIHRIPQRGEVMPCPLSFAQEQLWFLEQLNPGDAAYNLLYTVRLQGLLDVPALEQSLNEIVRRHESMRTTFATREELPVQIIVPTLTLHLPLVDLQNLTEAEQEAEARRLAIEEANLPFDLTQGPLLRSTLLQMSEQEHLLLLILHHIVFDDWSLGVFARELVALYEAFATGKPLALNPLPIQYADFATWQRQWLPGEVLETQLAYWRQQLKGAPALLELPTDHPRPAVQTFRGAQHSFVLSEELTDTLKALSRREGTTLFMTLLAAFNVLLYRYTGQTDIVIGSPIANRIRSEFEDLIGFFVNTLILRTDLSEHPTFEELLKRVREVALKAYVHQNLSFERLVEELHPERNLSYNPLFQVMFVLQSDPTLTFDLPGLCLRVSEAGNQRAKFDLSLSLRDTGQGLTGSWEYRTDLFEPATISRMVGHFQTLLEGIVADPEQHLDELPFLTEAERRQLLVEWNATYAEYPKDQCIHQLFEAQVVCTPKAVAAVFDGEQLTYEELNRRANQLAHHLQELGVGPEVLVGLYVERSLDMVVGLLGILKAGGAYVPLDPAFPAERIAFMLEDAQAPVLLTQQHLLTHLPAHGTQVVCLDSDAAVLAQQSQANPLCAATAAHLAYVIYTSGSTGRPKGVQILHRAAVNFLLSMREQPGLRAEDTLLAVTTLSFDIAALELFLPLMVGARLVVASRDIVADGRALIEALTRTHTTVMQATPVSWRLLLAAGWQGSQHLKMLCGGEALPRELAQQLLPRAASLWNLYGPTETTIWSTVCQIEAEDEVVTIGRPIANTQIYLLDTHLQPVPIGVPGELYIGGDGLARGYLNRPELTAERFVPHPCSEEPGARLYKTGDLARYLADGTIEHLGRLDFQVKLRGFRIELGEIEAVLAQHPAVRQAVVVVREDTPGDKRLVAYIVPTQGELPIVDNLRGYLKEKLPNYMIPSAFMLLDALPLTPNGKVDRRALPAPDPNARIREASFVGPTLPVHEQLIQMWEELLDVRPIGIRDNFFELGGHSLLVVRLFDRIERVWGKKIALATLLADPTIEQLAKALVQPEGLGSAAAALPVQVDGFQRPIFSVTGQLTTSVKTIWAKLKLKKQRNG